MNMSIISSSTGTARREFGASILAMCLVGCAESPGLSSDSVPSDTSTPQISSSNTGSSDAADPTSDSSGATSTADDNGGLGKYLATCNEIAGWNICWHAYSDVLKLEDIQHLYCMSTGSQWTNTPCPETEELSAVCTGLELEPQLLTQGFWYNHTEEDLVGPEMYCTSYGGTWEVIGERR